MRREDRRGSRLEPKVLEGHRGVLSKMRECAVVRWVSGPAACDATQGSRSPGLRTPTGNDQIIIPFCCVHSSHGIHDQKEKKSEVGMERGGKDGEGLAGQNGFQECGKQRTQKAREAAGPLRELDGPELRSVTARKTAGVLGVSGVMCRGRCHPGSWEDRSPSRRLFFFLNS